MRVRTIAAVYVCILVGSSNTLAQDDFGGGGAFGSGGSGVASDVNTAVDISREVRYLRLPHQHIKESIEKASARRRQIGDVEAAVNPSVLEAIQRSLQARDDFAFQAEPLVGIANWLSERLGKNVLFDNQALLDENVDQADEITFSAKQMTYAAALSHMLEPHNLTYTLSENVVTITSRNEAEEHMFTRIYPVWDLAKSPISDDEDLADYDSLVECIESTIEPNSWDSVGGPGSITSIKGVLAVSNTLEVQTEIARLLTTLRRFPPLLVADSETALTVVDLDDDVSKQRLQEVLQQNVRLEFADEPMVDAIRHVKQLVNAEILFDTQAMLDENVDQSDTVNLHVKDVTLGRAFELLLRDLNLTCIIDREALVITSEASAEETLRTRVYGCGDLVDAVDPPSYRRALTDLGELIQSIQSTISPASWDDVGGPGAMMALPSRGVLVVSQTDAVHGALQRHLEVLRRGRAHVASQGRLPRYVSNTTTVRAYTLSATYHTDDAQKQLVDLLVRLLAGSDNALHSGNPDFYARIVANNLIVSHRADAHPQLASILHKLGAVQSAPSELGGGMF